MWKGGGRKGKGKCGGEGRVDGWGREGMYVCMHALIIKPGGVESNRGQEKGERKGGEWGRPGPFTEGKTKKRLCPIEVIYLVG